MWGRIKIEALLCLAALALWSTGAHGQNSVRAIALKSGESTEMGMIYWITRTGGCRSLLNKIEAVEVLESPPDLTVTFREEMVLPRDCPKKVKGGIVIVSAKEIKAPVQGKLVYRIKYKTKDGDRLSSYMYDVALYP